MGVEVSQIGRKVLITGAAGGMGKACARFFGAADTLILTDVAAQRLDAFVADLKDEGVSVTAHAGDLASPELLQKLVGDLQGGQPIVLVHLAGLSPSLADAQAIMQVNLVATELLLQAVEPLMGAGSVAVLAASVAAHMMPNIPEVDHLLADPLAPNFLASVAAMLEKMGGDSLPGGAAGMSYSLSKQAILRLVERRAVALGSRGIRIVSISPGMILTGMGRSEIAFSQGAKDLLEQTPIGRVGTAMDIALAAHFLASPAATFITGCDLKVDGGGTAALAVKRAQISA